MKPIHLTPNQRFGIRLLGKGVKENPKVWSKGYLEKVARLKWEFNIFWSPPDLSIEKDKYIKSIIKKCSSK